VPEAPPLVSWFWSVRVFFSGALGSWALGFFEGAGWGVGFCGAAMTNLLCLLVQLNALTRPGFSPVNLTVSPAG